MKRENGKKMKRRKSRLIYQSFKGDIRPDLHARKTITKNDGADDYDFVAWPKQAGSCLSVS